MPPILLLDDNLDALDIRKRVLTNGGREVLEASSITEAIALLNERKEIDTVVLDRHLQEEGKNVSTVLAEFLRNSRPDLHIELYSSVINDRNELLIDGISSELPTKRSYLKSKSVVDSNKFESQSAFISYGGPDEVFANELNKYLSGRGVNTWFFPNDAVPGEKLHRTMNRGIQDHDRVLLICSSSSLVRPGVLNELERVLERESSEGGSDILIPIDIDGYVFGQWAPTRIDLADQIRARVVTRFASVNPSTLSFKMSAEKLVSALRQ